MWTVQWPYGHASHSWFPAMYLAVTSEHIAQQILFPWLLTLLQFKNVICLAPCTPLSTNALREVVHIVQWLCAFHFLNNWELYSILKILCPLAQEQKLARTSYLPFSWSGCTVSFCRRIATSHFVLNTKIYTTLEIASDKMQPPDYREMSMDKTGCPKLGKRIWNPTHLYFMKNDPWIK